MLTDEQVLTLWKDFDPPGWADWHKKYLDVVHWARTAPDKELRTRAAQKKLWTARDITPAGPGDSVNVEPLLEDPEVAEALVGLRKRAGLRRRRRGRPRSRRSSTGSWPWASIVA